MAQPLTITITVPLPSSPSLQRVRFVGFTALILFSVVMLGITSALTQGTYPGASTFAVGIASSVLTTVIPILVLIRETASTDLATSWTALELIWMFVAAIFWSVMGGISISYASWTCTGVCWRFWPYGRSSCGFQANTICKEFQVVAVFSWLNFLILAILFIWTMAVAMSASKKGDKFIWTSAAHAYAPRGIYLDSPSLAFNASDAALDKGKKTEEGQAERPRTPSPSPFL